MDPLSTTASVIAILQLTAEVIKYLQDVKDAPKECQQCTTEALNLQNLLINLLQYLAQSQSGDPWTKSVQDLNASNGPLDQYKQALEQLQAKVENQDSAQKIKRRLLWKFGKAEVASILLRMERLKSLISIALEMDHFQLSRALKSDLDNLQIATQSINDDTAFMRHAMPSLHTRVLAIRDTQGLQWGAQKLQRHEAILHWLSPTDFPSKQHDIINRRQEGTGQWLLDSPKFKAWLQGADRTLFCPGIPGAGKTMMAAIAIDYLGRLAHTDVGLAYLFCNYKLQVDQSVHGLLSALLKQLVQSRIDVAAPVAHLYDYHLKQKSRPSQDEIFTVLSIICSNYAGTYLVIDALDECSDQDGDRSRLVQKLRDLQAKTNLRLLFTSRFIPEITEKFRSDPILEVRANEEDIKRFIAGQIPILPGCIRRDSELVLTVQSKIVEAVDGMFLLARLHVDSLKAKRTKRKVLSTLATLSKGAAALDAAYHEVIQRIEGQPVEDRSLATRTISWICYAQRPLTSQELCHALSIELGDTELDGENVYDVKDIVSVCAGLVTIDEESDVVRLVHYTTHEYFERTLPTWNTSAQLEIASICLTYLVFDTFRTGSCGTDTDFEERIEGNVFLPYAARYWAEHVRPVEATVCDLAIAFLRNNACVLCSTQIMSVGGYKYGGYSGSFRKATTGLHLSARFGLVKLSSMLLSASCQDSSIDIDVDAKDDTDGETPLWQAADNGHEAAVKLQLEARADVDAKDTYGRTPLWQAAANGDEAIVKLLLEAKADVQTKDINGWTPLWQAADSGHEAVIKLLLEAKADVHAGDVYGRTPLWYVAEHEAVVTLLFEAETDLKAIYVPTPLWQAANNGHEDAVKLLLEAKANVDAKDINGRTPLWQAADNGHQAVVKVLLEAKADVHARDVYGRTSLSWAAAKGYKAVVKLLLEAKADVDAGDIYDRTPLWHVAKHEAVVTLLFEAETDLEAVYVPTPLWQAANNGHKAVVKLLLEVKADVDAKDINGRTPLWQAAANGHEAIVKLLLEAKADVQTKDINGWTPLWQAADSGHEAVVKLLLEAKADVDAKDTKSRTPLWQAANNGHEVVVKLLLEAKADVYAGDVYDSTPLWWAATKGHEAVVKLLLEAKADVDVTDVYGWTPLFWAAEKGHETVVKLLLQAKADIDAGDIHGRTSLWYVAANGHEAMVKLLLEAKANVDAKDTDGRTPLWQAARNRHEAVVKLLQSEDKEGKEDV